IGRGARRARRYTKRQTKPRIGSRSRLSGCEDTRGKIGVARIECFNTQRQKHCEEEGDHGKRPLAAFHGSTLFRSKKTTSLERRRRLSLKNSLSARVPRAAKRACEKCDESTCARCLNDFVKRRSAPPTPPPSLRR